jgi:predicted esterase
VPLVTSPLVSEKSVRKFEQRHLEVSRSARYAIMGSFNGPLSEVWIVCHGQGQLAARFLSRFLPLEREDRLFIAPEALSRYYVTPPKGGPNQANAPIGASWMTSEDREHEIEDYVRYLDLLHDEIFSKVPRAKVRLWVLGFSQGTATAARWVARGKVEPDRVVLWSGMVPPELNAESAATLARQAPLTVVFGRNDEFASAELIAAQEARVKELRVPHKTIRFDGGHEIVPDALRMLVDGSPS